MNQVYFSVSDPSFWSKLILIPDPKNVSKSDPDAIYRNIKRYDPEKGLQCTLLFCGPDKAVTVVFKSKPAKWHFTVSNFT